MPPLDDPDTVRAEYATEAGLLGRRAAYAHADGPNAPELAFRAVAEAAPGRVLEVGCGPGELAERLEHELRAEVVAVDLSPRMVELARQRGVDARVGDAQELPFEDASFDCVVAAWMLYHVPDVDRALAEFARVLVAGGRLVAVTNASDHLAEARELVGSDAPAAGSFPAEDAPAILARHFDAVESRDASGTVTFPDRDSLVAFVDSWRGFSGALSVPDGTAYPFVVRRRPVILVATKAP